MKRRGPQQRGAQGGGARAFFAMAGKVERPASVRVGAADGILCDHVTVLAGTVGATYRLSQSWEWRPYCVFSIGRRSLFASKVALFDVRCSRKCPQSCRSVSTSDFCPFFELSLSC